MKIAFFDAKPYDKPSFEKYGDKYGISFRKKVCNIHFCFRKEKFL